MSETATQIPAGKLGPNELGDVLRDYMVATERLQVTHETLQREVIRLRRELESKDRELERRRRLASLGELAAGVAHEVRNPLGAIQLYSGLLRDEFGGVESAKRLLEKIDAGIHAIDCVVRDTLALAPRRGQLARCVLKNLIDAAADVCRGTLETRGVRLETQYEDESLAVMGESAALQRVLVNLIANAAEASPQGETVRVTVTKDNEGRVVTRVADRGTGLSEEALERLFDPFFTTKEHGVGLGLTIAHRLAEAHGGGLTARNRAKGGAAFELALPSEESVEDRPATEARPGANSAA